MKTFIKISFFTFLLYFSCENNPAVYDDCNGVPNGPSNEDNCGICDNNPLNDCIQDCAGVWGGESEYDECENCNDNPDNNAIPDCNGNCIDNDYTDLKGILPDEYGSYIYEGMDCTGKCGGEKVIDICGRCDGEGDVYICGCDDIFDGEPFEDSNNNGVWDDVDEKNDAEKFEDLNYDGIYNPPECDCLGNVRSCYEDLNNNNMFDEDIETGNECPFEYTLVSKCFYDGYLCADNLEILNNEDCTDAEGLWLSWLSQCSNPKPEEERCSDLGYIWYDNQCYQTNGNDFIECNPEAQESECDNNFTCSEYWANECDPSQNSTDECGYGFTCHQYWDPVENPNYIETVRDKCGKCALPEEVMSRFRCSNGAICDPENENNCKGEYACSSQFIDGYPGSDPGECLLREDLNLNNTGDCDCLGVGNISYNDFGICGGANIDSEIYDCDFNCDATGPDLDDDGYDECGTCAGNGIIGGEIDGICACTDLDMNSVAIVADETDPTKMYFLFKVNNNQIAGMQATIEGVTIEEIYGGEAFTQNWALQSNQNKVLAFSFSNTPIDLRKLDDDGNPMGCGVLFEITVDNADNYTGMKEITFTNGNNVEELVYSYRDLEVINAMIDQNPDCIDINITDERSYVEGSNLLYPEDTIISWWGYDDAIGVEDYQFLGRITYLSPPGKGFICSIPELPSNFGNLTKLITLDLTNNELSEFPNEVINLPNLETINLSSNQITSIPNNICDNFDNSVNIDVSYNPLCDGINNAECLTYNYNDTDEDTISNLCDACPDDANNDEDGDGVCGCTLDDDNNEDTECGNFDNYDQCPGFDDNIDTDSDTIPDGCDICPGFDDLIDTDEDTIPDGCDD